MDNLSIKKTNVVGNCFIKTFIICLILFILAYFYCKNDKIFAYIYWNNDDIISDENLLGYKNMHTVRSIISTHKSKK